MLNVYCEHGAITKKLRAWQRAGRIRLIHFPYDPDGRSQHLRPFAKPSKARWGDLNVTWDEMTGHTWADFSGSDQLEEIITIIGSNHRRDALHVNSAFKSGCKMFVTCDGDILSKKAELELLLGIRFFHPEKDEAEMEAYMDEAGCNTDATQRG